MSQSRMLQQTGKNPGSSVRTWATGKCFHIFFEFSQTITSVSITRLETRRTCVLENTATNKKRKSYCLLWSSKCKYSLLALSLRNGSCYSSVFLSSYRNIYAFNQSANVFALGYFLNVSMIGLSLVDINLNLSCRASLMKPKMNLPTRLTAVCRPYPITSLASCP